MKFGSTKSHELGNFDVNTHHLDSSDYIGFLLAGQLLKKRTTDRMMSTWKTRFLYVSADFRFLRLCHTHKDMLSDGIKSPQPDTSRASPISHFLHTKCQPRGRYRFSFPSSFQTRKGQRFTRAESKKVYLSWYSTALTLDWSERTVIVNGLPHTVTNGCLVFAVSLK